MKNVDVMQPCRMADVLRALSTGGETQFLIDVDGTLPPTVWSACAPTRTVVWGSCAALESRGNGTTHVSRIRQPPDAAPNLPVQVLNRAVMHVAWKQGVQEQDFTCTTWLREAMQRAAFVVVSHPANDCALLAAELQAAGFLHALCGHHPAVAVQNGSATPHALALLGRHASYRYAEPKRVLALVSTFNDIDIIVDTIEHLWAQGVAVYIIDNWSTDGSWAILETLARNAPDRLVGLERYPATQADAQYDWHGILARKEAISQTAGYDWYLHYDSDELRMAPWPDVTLAEAIGHVDAMGYNAIDHTLIDFRPTEDGFDAQSRARDFFKHFMFNPRPGAFSQIKGWAAQSGPVHLPSTGGHAVDFAGRKVFPLKFLLKHYPLRSRAQAHRKVFTERLPRFAAEQTSRGWHGHYAQYAHSKFDDFLWDKRKLLSYEAGAFEKEFFVERLFGLGFKRQVDAAQA